LNLFISVVYMRCDENNAVMFKRRWYKYDMYLRTECTKIWGYFWQLPVNGKSC
jgi:hypothetical protein